MSSLPVPFALSSFVFRFSSLLFSSFSCLQTAPHVAMRWTFLHFFFVGFLFSSCCGADADSDPYDWAPPIRIQGKPIHDLISSFDIHIHSQSHEEAFLLEDKAALGHLQMSFTSMFSYLRKLSMSKETMKGKTWSTFSTTTRPTTNLVYCQYDRKRLTVWRHYYQPLLDGIVSFFQPKLNLKVRFSQKEFPFFLFKLKMECIVMFSHLTCSSFSY